jgi:sulfide dehydrogenase cytochrome subunit
VRILRLSAALTLLAVAAPASSAELRPPPGASSCAGCHAPGAVMGAIDGRPEGEIVTAMAEYRSGTRPASVMTRIAKGFSEDESRAIAAYLARRPAE